MQILDHERSEWKRLAADAIEYPYYADMFNEAALKDHIPNAEYDYLQSIYRAWLIGGWDGVLFNCYFDSF